MPINVSHGRYVHRGLENADPRCAACEERAAAQASGLRAGAHILVQGQQHANPAARRRVDAMDHIRPGIGNLWNTPSPPPPPASPAPNAAFPNFLPKRQPEQQPTLEALIICKGSKPASSLQLPYEMVTGALSSPQRSTTCSSLALITQPWAVAFLLTHEMGVAHVGWKQSEGLGGPKTSYSLRLE